MRVSPVSALIERAAAHRPSSVALEAPGRSPLTYEHLWELVRGVGHQLNAWGVGRGDRVAIVLPDGPDLAVTFLAVAAGATAAPLNPAYRAEELDRYLNDIRATAVIVAAGTTSPAPAVARDRGMGIIQLTPSPMGVAGAFSLDASLPSESASGGFAGPDEVALLLPTSGTTAGPKIVPLTHDNLYASADRIRATLQLSPSDRCLNVMPLFHVHGLIGALLASLAAGGCVVCSPGFDGVLFFDWVHAFQPTWYTAVPAIHQAILQRAASQRDAIEASPLRFIRSSSAPLPRRVLEELERVFGTPVVEAYGMTEASHQIASNPLPPGTRRPGSVGQAAGTDIVILDVEGLPVPSGMTGEIAIRGPNVAREYENNSEANARAFVGGWFRTGDQGLLDHDGYLFLTGRLKELINRGGEKIAPREVDDVLLEHPSVAQAATFAIPDERLGEDVAAAVVLHAGARTTSREIQEFALTRLALFKVPRQITIVAEIPKSATGKLQRAGLADKLSVRPPETRVLADTASARPVNPLQESLADLFAGVLGIERIGLHDDFFAAGGDSLLAARLVSRIATFFGDRVSILDLFEAPTVAALAERLADSPLAQTSEPAPLLVPTPRERALPLSFSQQRLWFIDQLEPGNPVYNRPVALRLRGRLDATRMAEVLSEIVRRHEVLRTRFPSIEGTPVQMVMEPQPVVLPHIDLQEMPADRRESRADEILRDEARRPFDLSAGPPLRATVIRLNEADHILLITFHHIVFDGSSVAVLVHELAETYEAIVEGRTATLPAVPVQFADFAVWQREWMRGPVEAAHLAYWSEQLAKLPPPLDLPNDRQRPPVQSYRGMQQASAIPAELVARLRPVGQSEGATLFMTLLAGLQAQLGRYTGQEDFVLGTPVAGRSRIETEAAIGCYVNTLVLRADLRGDPSFREVLRRVRRTAVEAYAHQDLPFERLIEGLKPDRSLSYNPVVQVMFALQPRPTPEFGFGGLCAAMLAIDTNTAKFDLSLSMEDDGSGGLRALLEYNTDLFDQSTASRMLEHYRILLEAIAADPDRRLSALPILTSAERRQLLLDWNDTTASYPVDRCIHELFEDQAARAPDRCAVIAGAERMTCGELSRRSNQLAHKLGRLGVGPEQVVGLCANRSPDLIAALLGILKAGGAYLPLDPDQPRDRLTFMATDAKIVALVAEHRAIDRLPDVGVPVVWLDSGGTIDTDERDAAPQSGVTSSNPMYVLYTSGSTGQPKGVVGLHRGTSNRFHWMWNAYPFSCGEVCCQKTPLGFVDSVWEIFGPLLQGIPLVIIPNDIVKDPHRLIDTLEAAAVTRIVLVPPLLEALLRAAPDLARRLPRLSHWTTSGAPLPNDLAARFLRLVPNRLLLNLYGMTEAAADVTAYEVNRTGETLIGRPIANTRIYLLDRKLEPVPVGVIGELYVAGDGLARGYLNRPGLSEAAFVPDPFSSLPGARLYRTGDLARYRADGNLEFAGRRDRQVKIRGYRVEPGEVESSLRQSPGVQDIAVVAREDSPGENQLVAYVVPAHGGAVDELRGFARETLPDYMVPSAFVGLEALPLNSSGKLDLRSLPRLTPSSARGRDYLAPRDPLERQLTAVWEEVLDLNPISVRDDFFEVGGHSLLAVRLFEKIRKTTRKDIPLSALYRAPTIERLAAVLRTQPSWSPTTVVAIHPFGSRPPFFCVQPNAANVLAYRDLARQLGSDQPFYILQPHGTEGSAPSMRLQDVVVNYIHDILDVQPKGPYFLGGWSHGGRVALEIARQLEEQRRPVAFLALFDSYGPDFQRPEVRGTRLRLLSLVERVDRHRSTLAQGGEKLAYVAEKTKIVVGRLANRLWHRRADVGASFHAATEDTGRPDSSYLPDVYTGSLVLFRAQKQPPGSEDTSLGWTRIARGGLAIHEVPGHHYSILRQPHVKELARRLRACIDRANDDHLARFAKLESMT